MNKKKYQKPRIAHFRSRAELAEHLNVSSAHISRWINGRRIGPKLRKALVKKGYIDPPPTRTRIAFDVSPELRDAINAECRRRGMTRGQWLEWAERVSQWQKVDRWTPANPLIVTVDNPPDTASG